MINLRDPRHLEVVGQSFVVQPDGVFSVAIIRECEFATIFDDDLRVFILEPGSKLSLKWTHLEHILPRVRCVPPLSERCGADLKQCSIIHSKPYVPLQLFFGPRVVRERQARVVQATQVDVTDDFWPKPFQHLILRIEIRTQELFHPLVFGLPGEGREAGLESGKVKVDRDAPDVVHGPNDVLYLLSKPLQKFLQIIEVQRRNVLRLESDEQSHFILINPFETMSFLDVFFELLYEIVRRQAVLSARYRKSAWRTGSSLLLPLPGTNPKSRNAGRALITRKLESLV